MSIYSVGDKFEIEIDRIYKTKQNGEKKFLYGIKGFNSLVFDEYGLNQLNQTNIVPMICAGEIVILPDYENNRETYILVTEWYMNGNEQWIKGITENGDTLHCPEKSVDKTGYSSVIFEDVKSQIVNVRKILNPNENTD